MRQRHITKYDLELLGYLANGFTNQQIAEKLDKSVNTIKDSVVRVFNKLDTKNRTEAVSKAIRLGIIK